MNHMIYILACLSLIFSCTHRQSEPEQLVRFERDNLWGYTNENGEIVIEPQFDFASPFSDGLAAVCMGCEERGDGDHRWFSGGSWGYINHQGTVVIPLQFDRAEHFEDGKARVMANGEWHYIDKNGEIVQ